MKRLQCFILLISLLSAAHAQEINQIDESGQISTVGRNRNPADSLGSNKEIPKGLKVWTVDERFGDRTIAVPDTLPYMYMNSVFTTGRRGEYNTLGNLGSPRINRIFIDQLQPQQFMFTQPYDFFITPVEKFHFTNTLSPITNISYDECGDKINGEDHVKALFGVNVGRKLGVGFKFDYIYGRGYYQNQSTALFNYTMYGSYLGDRYQAHLLMSTNHQKIAENGGITDDRYVTHPEIFQDQFRTDEIPTVLSNTWNRNDNQHVFFTHHYSIGFNRKVKMTEEEIKAKKFAMESQQENDKKKAMEEARRKAQKEGRTFDEENFGKENTYSGRPDNAKIAGDEPPATTLTPDEGNRISVNGLEQMDSLSTQQKEEAVKEDTVWLKNEFVPVTSFIHTAKFENYRRIFQAYSVPTDYYQDTFLDNQKFSGDSIFDKMKHYNIRNTFAISLLEGFNKWAKAGLKAFVASDLRHFTLPDTVSSGFSSYNEHNISVGGQMSKTEGSLLHYSLTAETWLVGEDAGQLKLDATADLNFRLFGDTVRLAARGYLYRLTPTFYHRHFQSKHLWWDNTNLDKETRTRIEGLFRYEKTKTSVRIAVDDIQNFTYFAQQYTVTSSYDRTGNTVSVKQSSDNIGLFTLQFSQDFKFGPLNWESQVTYQKSNSDVLSVPDLNVYSNLYFHFVISKVLHMDLGADIRYFTKYYAPDYSPALGQFAVQDNGENNVKVGGYPIINAYANMFLKHTRFFVMMSHVNAGDGGNRFYTPHYPQNGMVLRFGVSWNFFN